MDNGMVLFITLILIVALIVGGQYFLRKERATDQKALPKQLELFRQAVKYNDVEDIVIHIEKLIWNRRIRVKHLEEIEAVLQEKLQFHPKFEELKSTIYNRKLSLYHPTYTFVDEDASDAL